MRIDLVEINLSHALLLCGHQANNPVITLTYRGIGAVWKRHRKRETTVVIGVLTNHVHAPRRRVEGFRTVTVGALEKLGDFARALFKSP